MRARAILATMLLITSVLPVSARVRISDDLGGQIGDYLVKFRALRLSGERVEIDGVCASACTMLLGSIPQNRICVTPQAVLEFHSAWNPTPWGGQTMSDAGNQILWSTYPSPVRHWITRHGGLGPQIIYLRGRALSTMYRSCRQ